ncbi:hypothetical protein ABZ890_12145 [Streptomyces sp. NPDC046984]|uniref:hypothetical protein n=1 Tax=Streptomyces sp. NPDC046984 TaxID=3155138 RepID=UPI00340EA6AC
MTREERRAYIRRIVDAAPPLTPEDADLLRALIPLSARRALAGTATVPRPKRPRTAAA